MSTATDRHYEIRETIVPEPGPGTRVSPRGDALERARPRGHGSGAGEEAPVFALTHPTQDDRDLLVPTDFSPGSIAALRVASRLARRDGASMHLIHVFDVPTRLASDSMSGMKALFEVEDHARTRLHALARSVEPDASVEYRVGDPPTVIAERARELEAERIVMGAHRRPGPGPVGSVAREVRRQADCPVVLVAATDR